ncbi:unnamed protein product [Paramecium sonneborni]|uniref:Uncharacterized protein n=1 Tax=Paramecium sonneborni TaxID=65129 RepID=A0A8S1QXD2_9CILI|nr:unnamed protein product [Paramecium sonneborni]
MKKFGTSSLAYASNQNQQVELKYYQTHSNKELTIINIRCENLK